MVVRHACGLRLVRFHPSLSTAQDERLDHTQVAECQTVVDPTRGTRFSDATVCLSFVMRCWLSVRMCPRHNRELLFRCE